PTPTAQQPEDSSPETDEEDLESEPMDIGDGKTIDIHQIHQNWERLRRLVRNHDARCAGLLNSCKPIQLKDGILVLGFQSEVVRSKMEDGKNIDLTRRAILHMLKAKVKIRTIVMSGKIDLSAMDPKEAASGGMVGEALNLGGRIEKKE
ncbi:MAG: hypothetical protein JW750_01365, partial [Anaerolineaceae bacterium]|nr:hypothetical protein [Anaerolineaceae bacterium]